MTERDRIALEAFRRLGTQRAVERETGIPQNSVSKILIRNGIRRGRGNWDHTRIPTDEIVARYLAGETCKQIAESLNFDKEQIRRRLHRRGIKLRRRGADGAANFQWKGGTVHNREKHYRNLAYAVVAICLGAPLTREQSIHHVDENYLNNAPENLMVFPDNATHNRFHQQLLKIQRLGIEVDSIQLAIKNGGLVLPPPPFPIRFGLDKGRHVLLDTTGKRLHGQTVLGLRRSETPVSESR